MDSVILLYTPSCFTSYIFYFYSLKFSMQSNKFYYIICLYLAHCMFFSSVPSCHACLSGPSLHFASFPMPPPPSITNEVCPSHCHITHIHYPQCFACEPSHECFCFLFPTLLVSFSSFFPKPLSTCMTCTHTDTHRERILNRHCVYEIKQILFESKLLHRFPVYPFPPNGIISFPFMTA